MLVVPGIAFELFGRRTLANFGRGTTNQDGQYESRTPLLRDPNTSHPNLELRIAFMNYFINSTSRNREVVDQLLYNREVAPVHQQEFAPYIFQGQEKTLP